jgi:hypothetical protein
VKKVSLKSPGFRLNRGYFRLNQRDERLNQCTERLNQQNFRLNQRIRACGEQEFRMASQNIGRPEQNIGRHLDTSVKIKKISVIRQKAIRLSRNKKEGAQQLQFWAPLFESYFFLPNPIAFIIFLSILFASRFAFSAPRSRISSSSGESIN